MIYILLIKFLRIIDIEIHVNMNSKSLALVINTVFKGKRIAKEKKRTS